MDVLIRTSNTMQSDEFDYLQGGFDPWSCTIPRLRYILVKHNINYPSNANKLKFVEIFNDKIVPKSQDFLTELKKGRSDEGIINAQ